MGTQEALEATVAALALRVDVLESTEAIRRLKARYGELADSRYDRSGVRPADDLARIADEVVTLFTEDAVWDGGRTLGLATGRAEIAARFREPTLLFSWHYFVKPQIVIDGERARASWDILAPCTTRDGRPHWMSGLEEDEYERVGGAWLHSRMKLRPVFMAPHETGWPPPKVR